MDCNPESRDLGGIFSLEILGLSIPNPGIFRIEEQA